MRKIALLPIAALLLGTVSCGNQPANTATVDKSEIVIENIMNRKSVRAYTDQAVEQEKVDKILKAAMAAPSANNRQPWEFIVVNQREVMSSMAEALPYAKMLTQAPMAIIVCGNTASQLWYQDCAAATQNILLAAEALGLGAVWTAAYPYEDRMGAVKANFALPEGVLPLCVIPMGYPSGNDAPKDKFDQSKIHVNQW